MQSIHRGPSWEALFEVAEAQQGCFTTGQAAEAGISSQLLQGHLKHGNIERLHRGIYRMTRFPSIAREQEDLIVAWLWSARTGVFSHETALQLHDLSDAMPSYIHLTLPTDWPRRRISPRGVQTYFADLTPDVCTFVGSVPVTKPARSITDVARAYGDANVIEAAIQQALNRGTAAVAELSEAVGYVAGGAPAGHTRVRPEAVAGLQGSWLTEIIGGEYLGGPPPPDWRIELEYLVHEYGGRVRSAEYFKEDRVMFIEMVWPISARDTKPSWDTLRDDAVEILGWDGWE